MGYYKCSYFLVYFRFLGIMDKPIQRILFGSPGTGKSYKVDNEIIPETLDINVEKTPENVIKAVFHPEYTYGDFVGKLMPITTEQGNVKYSFYEGHFLKALARAYNNIIEAEETNEEVQHVVLVIDEINRGNSSSIFGSIFQLLDREKDGCSSYHINVNEIIFSKLLKLIKVESYPKKEYRLKEGIIESIESLQEKFDILGLGFDLNNQTIKIPANLSIIATMNTSDSSIYYMDSAFKRRWEWEFIDIDGSSVCKMEGENSFKTRKEWQEFVNKLNKFIKQNHRYIRGIEDKQVGHYFIQGESIKASSIQNKLMFFLWDSVFSRDKKPLIKLLYGENQKEHDELITFGDFAKQVEHFIKKIKNYKNSID